MKHYIAIVLMTAFLSMTAPHLADAKRDVRSPVNDGDINAPEHSFYSVRGWRVSPSAVGMSNRGVPETLTICSLETVFNNGFAFTFSGDKHVMKTLDINFQQNILTADQAYKIELASPGVKNRALEASASSATLLSINMHDHQDLFDAMKAAAVTDLTMGVNRFRFFLTGIGAAMRDFNECTHPETSFYRPSPSSLEGVVVPPAFMPESADLRPSMSMDRPDSLPDSIMVSETVPLQQVDRNEPLDITRAPTPLDNRPPPVPSIDLNQEIEETESRITAEISPPSMSIPSDNVIDFTNLPSEDVRFETEEAPILPPENIVENGAIIQRTVIADSDGPIIFDGVPVDLRRQKSDMEQRLVELERRNRELQEEVNLLNSGPVAEYRRIANENWNLEQAATRYEEAKKQIDLLSNELRAQQNRHEEEVRRLEAMLFDPAITSRQQQQKVENLKNELQQTRAQLNQIDTIPAMPAPNVEEITHNAQFDDNLPPPKEGEVYIRRKRPSFMR